MVLQRAVYNRRTRRALSSCFYTKTIHSIMGATETFVISLLFYSIISRQLPQRIIGPTEIRFNDFNELAELKVRKTRLSYPHCTRSVHARRLFANRAGTLTRPSFALARTAARSTRLKSQGISPRSASATRHLLTLAQLQERDLQPMRAVHSNRVKRGWFGRLWLTTQACFLALAEAQRPCCHERRGLGLNAHAGMPGGKGGVFR